MSNGIESFSRIDFGKRSFFSYFLTQICFNILIVFLTLSTTQASNCCIGLTGNVDNSPSDEVDIGDITKLIDYLFISLSTPVCLDEANCDGIGSIDIGDLTALIDYLFISSIPPAVCSASNLTFSDEFSGPAGQSPNSNYWDYDIGTNWGNLQLEYDTDRPFNVSLDGNGNLAIIAREEWYMGQPYTSARIVTRDKFEPTYGRVEARIKLPVGQGIWPAFWLLGANIDEVGWPTCGEIDIMEYRGQEPSTILGSLHGPGYSGGASHTQYVTLENETFDTAFHVFAVEWTPEKIDWYLDSNLYQTLTPNDVNGSWVFDHPFYIILNVAVGGTFVGSPDGTTVFPQTMLIDYVRVYDSDSTIIQTEPSNSAPIPTIPATDVISLYSDTYTNVTVDTWSADWDDADVEDFVINSDSTKKYTNLVFAGIEFTSSTIDVSSMTHFHMDVWTPDATISPSVFKVKLVDFGANGVWDGNGDDVEHEITLVENIMNTGSWVSIDLPLSSFTNLITTEHLAQLIISGNPNTVFVDNIYFYNSNIPSEPSTPAPSPSFSNVDVISIFSDTYSNVTVDTWSAFWDNANVEDFVIGSNNIKKYTNLVFAGIEITSPSIDAFSMTHFHINVWTPDPTAAPSVFKIKLVDFGANGVWDGGGDDVEHEITLDENIMNTGNWVTIDVPLTEFINLTTREHIAQLIISGTPSTVFIDNILFHK